jgi:4-hydroxy-tetrahydrodipicolinate synthase
MLPETVGRLSRVPNIVGIKEATADMGRVKVIRELCGDDFDIYSGDDATACDLVLLGGQGVISVTANVAPKAMHDMVAAALAGDAERARAIDATIADLHRDLFLEANPIPVKWALAEMGRIPKGIRLPLTWFSQALQDKLRKTMIKAGIL